VVINTHRMLCANQQMMAQAWRFLEHEKPVLVDWLPWSHTFGGNHNLNLVLRTAARCTSTRAGRRPAHREDHANLREVQPTLYFNVPRGYEMMLPALEPTTRWRATSSPLRMVFYAGAALPQATWERLEAVAAPRARRAAVVHHQLGQHRDRAGHHQRALEARPRRRHRPAAAGRGAEVHPQRQQAGDARARRHVFPGYQQPRA
jgi:acyl-CoA synthetase (AMP-forming)/AMP-acid ligase II